MAQALRQHLMACPSLKPAGLPADCSCRKEVWHYLKLARWSLGLFVFELVGGRVSGSQALVADAFHVLSDLGENLLLVAVPFFVIYFGWKEKFWRSFASIASALFLFLIVGDIIYEGWLHLLDPHPVKWYMGPIALISAYVVTKQLEHHDHALHEHRNANHFWQWLHLFLDKWSLRGVIAGWVIMTVMGGWYWIDGALSIVIGLAIMALTVAKLFGVDIHSHFGEEHARHKPHHPHGHGCSHDHDHH